MVGVPGFVRIFGASHNAVMHTLGIRAGFLDEHHRFGLIRVEKLGGNALSRFVARRMNLDERRMRAALEALGIEYRKAGSLDTGDDRVEMRLVTDVDEASAQAEIKHSAE